MPQELKVRKCESCGQRVYNCRRCNKQINEGIDSMAVNGYCMPCVAVAIKKLQDAEDREDV